MTLDEKSEDQQLQQFRKQNMTWRQEITDRAAVGLTDGAQLAEETKDYWRIRFKTFQNLILFQKPECRKQQYENSLLIFTSTTLSNIKVWEYSIFLIKSTNSMKRMKMTTQIRPNVD